MDDFLKRYQVPKLNQDWVNHLNSPINPREIEAVIKSFTTKKSPGLDDYSAEFYQTLKDRPNTNTSQTIPQNKNRMNTA